MTKEITFQSLIDSSVCLTIDIVCLILSLVFLLRLVSRQNASVDEWDVNDGYFSVSHITTSLDRQIPLSLSCSQRRAGMRQILA